MPTDQVTQLRYYVPRVRTVQFAGEPRTAIVHIVDGGTGNAMFEKLIPASDAARIADAVAVFTSRAEAMNNSIDWQTRPRVKTIAEINS